LARRTHALSAPRTAVLHFAFLCGATHHCAHDGRHLCAHPAPLSRSLPLATLTAALRALAHTSLPPNTCILIAFGGRVCYSNWAWRPLFHPPSPWTPMSQPVSASWPSPTSWHTICLYHYIDFILLPHLPGGGGGLCPHWFYHHRRRPSPSVVLLSTHTAPRAATCCFLRYDLNALPLRCTYAQPPT